VGAPSRVSTAPSPTSHLRLRRHPDQRPLLDPVRHRGRGRARYQGLQLDQRSVPSQPQLMRTVLSELTVLILPRVGTGRLQHRVRSPGRTLVIRFRPAPNERVAR